MDWHEAVAGTGGGLFVAVLQWLLGRSDTAASRRRQEIAEVSVRAVEESEKFALAGEQTLINQRIRDDIAAVRKTVDGIDSKFDQLFLTGRLHIPRKGDQDE